MTRRETNEGSIYKRTDGRWVSVIHLGYEGGRRRRKNIYGKTRQDVATKLNAALRAQQQGLPQPAERQTVAAFMTRWLENAQPTLRPKTYIGYEVLIRRHINPGLGRLALTKLGPEHLENLYQQRLSTGLSPTTVSHIHALIHHALKSALRQGHVARNVADLVDAPRGRPREMRTLSREEATRMLDAAREDRLEALYVLALTTGARQGELLAIRWRDCDLARATLRICGALQRTKDGLAILEPKTAGSRRPIILSREAVSALMRHRIAQAEERLKLGSAWEDNDLVFANEIGRPIEARNMIRRSFLPLLKRAGIQRIRFHDLRHSAASLLLEQGTHPKLVAELLGHSRISTTLDLYSHVTPAMHHEAAATMDALLGDRSR